MQRFLARRSRRSLLPSMRLSVVWFGLALLWSGCGGGDSSPQVSDELLLVYSGDFRGFVEPCG